MADAIESIVDFDRPPVIEVVLGVQFPEAVVDLEVLAGFATAIKDRFPNRQQVEPLPRATESFDRPPEGPRVEFRLGGPPLPRTWFLSADDRLLVQLQSDRLILNWRRVEPGDLYPRYRVLRPQFDDLRGQLFDLLGQAGKQSTPIDHVEVSYHNELARDDWGPLDTHLPLEGLITTVADLDAGGFLPTPEDVGYQARFRIPSPVGSEVATGRLIVSTEPAYRVADQRPIYLLKLSANLVGTLEREESVIEMLNLGRRWVVNGFLQLTTPEIQATWGPKP